MRIIKIIVLLFFLFPSIGFAVVEATLPQIYIDTTYSAPTGSTCHATSSAELTACLANAELNTTITLDADATFNGPFALPNISSGSGWLYIISDELSSMPEGTRIGTSDATYMPMVYTESTGVSFITEPGAHHIRLAGIHMEPVAGNFSITPLVIGATYQYCTASTEPISCCTGSQAGATCSDSVDDVPQNIIIDRCLIRGLATQVNIPWNGNPSTAIRGMILGAEYGSVIDSHIDRIKTVGQDAQAIWIYDTAGPIKVVNNYLEASGENMMSGGADTQVVNENPKDIEVSRNHFFKQLTWRVGDPSYEGTSWYVKNSLEFKAGERILVHGNLLENNWSGQADQRGMAFVLTPRNQSGGDEWTNVLDITFRYNVIKNSNAGINMLGSDTDYTSQNAARFNIHDNLFLLNPAYGQDNHAFQSVTDTSGYPDDVIINNNTVFNVGMALIFTDSTQMGELEFKNNMCDYGGYGVLQTGVSGGTPSLNGSWSTWTFTNNVLFGGFDGATYPANNWNPANETTVKFDNYTGGTSYTSNYSDYALDPTSDYAAGNTYDGTDGEDLGADIVLLVAAQQGSEETSIIKKIMTFFRRLRG